MHVFVFPRGLKILGNDIILALFYRKEKVAIFRSDDNMPPKAKKEDSTATNVGEEDDGFPSEETFKAQLEKNPDGKIALLHCIKFELLSNR